ncbi:hypothetical protein ACFQ3W_11565 [Paenibacillus puldeungensis]|uniref:SLH domain-containing protein n=2 Tax=Paenibacillus puldeungensis TaxID=696536 RepID=A0ABW3RX04_9BACL
MVQGSFQSLPTFSDFKKSSPYAIDVIMSLTRSGALQGYQGKATSGLDHTSGSCSVPVPVAFRYAVHGLPQLG